MAKLRTRKQVHHLPWLCSTFPSKHEPVLSQSAMPGWRDVKEEGGRCDTTCLQCNWIILHRYREAAALLGGCMCWQGRRLIDLPKDRVDSALRKLHNVSALTPVDSFQWGQASSGHCREQCPFECDALLPALLCQFLGSLQFCQGCTQCQSVQRVKRMANHFVDLSGFDWQPRETNKGVKGTIRTIKSRNGEDFVHADFRYAQ